MTAHCPACGVYKLSHDEAVIEEFLERHRTQCPGDNVTLFPQVRNERYSYGHGSRTICERLREAQPSYATPE